MKNRFKRFKTWLVPKNDDRVYVSLNNQKFLYKEVIDGVIVAKSGADLKILLEKVRSIHWTEPTRHMFLLGLLQGTLMQFKKDVSVEELKDLFYDI